MTDPGNLKEVRALLGWPEDDAVPMLSNLCAPLNINCFTQLPARLPLSILLCTQIFFSGHGDLIKAAAILHKVKVHFLGPGQSPQLVEEERRAPNGNTTVVPLPGFIW